MRLEAALALSRGCCCNKSTIQALSLTVSGSDEDGRPPEVSDRVKGAALMALNNCLSHVVVEPPLVEPLPIPIPNGDGKKLGELEKLPPPSPGKTTAVVPGTVKGAGPTLTYYQRIERLPLSQVVNHASRVLHKMGSPAATTTAQRSGDGSVMGVIQSVFAAPAGPAQHAAGGEKTMVTARYVVVGEKQASNPPPAQPSPPGSLRPTHREPLCCPNDHGDRAARAGNPALRCAGNSPVASDSPPSAELTRLPSPALAAWCSARAQSRQRKSPALPRFICFFPRTTLNPRLETTHLPATHLRAASRRRYGAYRIFAVHGWLFVRTLRPSDKLLFHLRDPFLQQRHRRPINVCRR